MACEEAPGLVIEKQRLKTIGAPFLGIIGDANLSHVESPTTMSTMAYEREHTCATCPTTFIARSARRKYCDPCKVKAMQEWERARYERVGVERRASYVSKNQEKLREQAKARYHCKKHDPEFREMVQNCVLRSRYGINSQELNQLGEAQDWRCAICERTAEEAHTNGKRLHVDHDHLLADLGFGKEAVRGLLCFDCNSVVGGIFDSPEIARRLLEYVTNHAARREELLSHVEGDISNARSPRTRNRKATPLHDRPQPVPRDSGR